MVTKKQSKFRPIKRRYQRNVHQNVTVKLRNFKQNQVSRFIIENAQVLLQPTTWPILTAVACLNRNYPKLGNLW